MQVSAIGSTPAVYAQPYTQRCSVQRREVQESPFRVRMVRRSWVDLTMEEITGEVETKYGIMQYRKVMVRREEGSYIGVEGYV